MELLLSNPPKRSKRRRRKGRRKLYGAAAMAVARARAKSRRRRRSTKRRRRSTSGGGVSMRRRRRSVTRRRATRRRRRTGLAAVRRGFSTRETVVATAGVVGGFFGTNLVTDQVVSRIPVPQLQSGYGRIAAKAAVALLGGLAIATLRPTRRFAVPYAAGGLASATFDLILAVRQRASGVSGYGYGYPHMLGGYEHARAIASGMSGYVGAGSGDYIVIEE